MTTWGLFVAISIVSWLISQVMWWPSFNIYILGALGLFSLALGTRVLLRTGMKVWPIVGVAVGLLIGQLWFSQMFFAFAIWYFRGFAP
jgi:hypothetical protein